MIMIVFIGVYVTLNWIFWWLILWFVVLFWYVLLFKVLFKVSHASLIAWLCLIMLWLLMWCWWDLNMHILCFNLGFLSFVGHFDYVFHFRSAFVHLVKLCVNLWVFVCIACVHCVCGHYLEHKCFIYVFLFQL